MKSHICRVLSGVPQGAVLGPFLFLLCINGLPSKISTTIKLYADDVILYREMSLEDDILILQTDLSIIASWAQGWFLKSIEV